MSKRRVPTFEIVKNGSATTVSLGDRSVKIYDEGPAKHRLTWSVGGKRKRRAYPNAAAAEEAAKDVLNQMVEGREDLTKTPAQRIEYLLQLEKAVYPATLEEVVQAYLKHRPTAIKPRMVREVMDEMIEAKKAARDRKGSSNRWVNTLKHRLGKFADRFACPINNITPEELEAFLQDPGHGWSERTRYNIQQTVMSLFNFARRKGYLATSDNPMDRIERSGAPPTDPEVFTPDQLRRLFRAAAASPTNAKIIPYIAIGAFAGLRSAEICRLTWKEHIDLEEGVIRLPSDITKTKRRRAVSMHPTLIQWLRLFKKAEGKVVPYFNVHKFTLRIAQKAKVEWVQNGLRHSCISYGMVINPNAHHWAEQSGHSVAILQTNYKQLVSKKDADLWFAVSPESLAKKGDPEAPNHVAQPPVTRQQQPS